MAATDELTFECPQCEESLVVNAAMRDALIANGCVVCGAALTQVAFSSAE